MTQPSVEVHPDIDSLNHAAAERIVRELEEMLREKETTTLVLTGGKTPRPVYELMSAFPYSNRIDWNRIHFFWGDERCVQPDNPESNFGMAWDALISKIPARPSHIHRIIGELEDQEKAASLYETEILRILAGAKVPSFDLVLLGMGEDGHTASLFPGTQWDEARLVVTNRKPGSASTRISMTPTILNQAREIIFIAHGLNKARALASVLNDPASSLPAARIRPVHGSVTWMVDSEAASLLTQD